MTDLCLNMIVKNEVANLERCLRSVVDNITCWVIADTGSSDGTQDLIRSFFEARGVPGELHSIPFENFGQARNEALDLARASPLRFDYLLLADADMELTVDDPNFARHLTADAYQLHQDSGVAYWNTRLLRRDAQARYVGVTHEYLDIRGGETRQLDGVAYIDHASGANRAGKFARDAALLSAALETETDSGLRARYTFYLANSLRDDGDRAGALKYFLERARLGHWPEEVFVSLLNAAEIKNALGHPIEEVLATYAEATAACPTRAEAYHGAARLCRNNARHEQGYQFAAQGLTIPLPRAGLFVSGWIYSYGLLDELAVTAYWTSRYDECIAACDRLLAEPSLPKDQHPRVLQNKQFAVDRLREQSDALTPAVPHAAATSSPSPSPRHWQPDRPLAGTELMVEGLRKRMAGELERIDLRVNLFDPATLETRPLVLWMHHDVDQAAVQWCRDPALVAKVARFVFISHWQKDRYVAAFDLKPERCTVIRYAMEQTTDMRRWEPAPILRCAYISTPFRGLDVLLDAWQDVAPDRAELHIWSSMKLYMFDDGAYQHLFDRARNMPGVVYHGLAPNEELRAALRTMHFLTYPNTFAETACLSVMEAMAAGCRIIAPAYGALPETTGGYARIYPWCGDRRQHATVFAKVLADEMAMPWRGRPDTALSQQSHCAAVFAWSRCLDEWRELIGTLQ